jgi:hypothetical protein
MCYRHARTGDNDFLARRSLINVTGIGHS